MKFLTTLFLFVFSLGAFAQLVTNNPVEIGIGPIAFNSKNIKKNKIKKIDVVIVDTVIPVNTHATPDQTFFLT